MDFVCSRGFASAEATKGLSDRPLETFGASPPMLQCCIVAWKVRTAHKLNQFRYSSTNMGVQAKESRGRPQSPLEATSKTSLGVVTNSTTPKKHNHQATWECTRRSPEGDHKALWKLHAKPCMQRSSTQSRERESRGSKTLWRVKGSALERGLCQNFVA